MYAADVVVKDSYHVHFLGAVQDPVGESHAGLALVVLLVRVPAPGVLRSAFLRNGFS